MSKAVMLSIRPKWCEKIVNGDKTIEVRKTRPKMNTPFKCYIYCTLQGCNEFFRVDLGRDVAKWNRGKWADRKGNVIGEFTCGRIDRLAPANEPYGIYDIDDDYVLQTCLENGALWDYGRGTPLYGWHISNLKIYDTPKELTEFHTWWKCKSCSKSGYESTACIYDENCMIPEAITKAPQSWCYVQEG